MDRHRLPHAALAAIHAVTAGVLVHTGDIALAVCAVGCALAYGALSRRSSSGVSSVPWADGDTRESSWRDARRRLIGILRSHVFRGL